MKPCEKCWGTGEAVDHEKLGKKARKRRRRAGFSLKQAAVVLGVSEAMLCLLENGKRNWTKELYEKATK